MKKSLLIAVAAIFVALSANAQVKRAANFSAKKFAPTKAMRAEMASTKEIMPMRSVGTKVSKKALKKAASDIVGAYVMDFQNYNHDFTGSSAFTIEEETGTITLDQYEDKEGNPVSFDYNVKLTDFTMAGGVAYGEYDESTNSIFIPVQTIYNHSSYGRIVLSGLVLDKDGSPYTYGEELTLLFDTDGSVTLDEGDFSEKIAEDPTLEGIYIGGFWNFMPDDLNSNGNPYCWNRGLDTEFFAANSVIEVNETHVGSSGWSDWEWQGYYACVEDWGNELVVHNFIGRPVSITVDGTSYKIAAGQEFDDYDYEDPYGRIRLWRYDNDAQALTSEGFITGRAYKNTEGQGLQFYETEYKEAWTDTEGVEHEAGNYYIVDRSQWFYLRSNPDTDGLGYWAGEYRYMNISVPASITLTLNDGSNGTGINGVKDFTQTTSNKTYNVMGQEVNANVKGVVIRDGKKFVNK